MGLLSNVSHTFPSQRKGKFQYLRSDVFVTEYDCGGDNNAVVDNDDIHDDNNIRIPTPLHHLS
jgi:hypothetical protein